MLLFGAHLGGKKPPDPSQGRDEAKKGEADSKPKRTEKEKKLLEEIERTQRELIQEWKKRGGTLEELPPSIREQVKETGTVTKAEKGRNKSRLLSGGSNVPPLSPGREKEAHAEDILPPSPPVISHKNGLDMLPILTSSGDTPFESGLGKGPKGENLLPLFRLPNVKTDAKIINKLLKDPTPSNNGPKEIDEDGEYEKVDYKIRLKDGNQKESKEEAEAKENEELKQALGLTEEELRDFLGKQRLEERAELIGGSADQVDNREERGIESSFTGFQGFPPLTIESKRRIEEIALGRSTPRVLRSGLRAQPEELRAELDETLQSMQILNKLVKKDIELVHKIVPISDIKARLYIKKWGVQKVERILLRLSHSLLTSAFSRWTNAIKEEKRQAKRTAFLQYKGAKLLLRIFGSQETKSLSSAWRRWARMVSQFRKQERLANMEKAARSIQRAYRGHFARGLAKLIREQQRRDRENKAATRIQAFYKSKAESRRFKLLITSIRQNKAAQVIQRYYRKLLEKKRRARRRRDNIERKAAIVIQSRARVWLARRLADKLRVERDRNKAATKIQARARGMLARQLYVKLKEQRHRNLAAAKIQALARGRRDRKLCRDLRIEYRAKIKREQQSALKIQKVYRGHRGRVIYQIKRDMYLADRREKDLAAAKIQGMYRGWKVRRRMREYRREKFQYMIQLARQWTEVFDESANRFFYYKAETGEAMWLPPQKGYVRHDGSMVLMSGDVIEDPSTFMNEDEEADIGRGRFCVECEKEVATFYCKRCEDKFCDSCFERLHKSTRRKEHEYEAIGPRRCVECERKAATKWCAQCDDPFCDPCFQLIHSKGKKAMHEAEPVDDDGNRLGQQGQQPTPPAYLGDYTAAEGYGYDYDPSIPYYQPPPEAWPQKADTAYAQDATQPEGHGYDYQGAEPYLDSSGQQGAMPAFSPEYSAAEGYGAEYEPSLPEAGAGATSGSEWITAVDEESGHSYLYNPVTGESKWI